MYHIIVVIHYYIQARLQCNIYCMTYSLLNRLPDPRRQLNSKILWNGIFIFNVNDLSVLSFKYNKIVSYNTMFNAEWR